MSENEPSGSDKNMEVEKDENKKELTTKEAYFAALNEWVKQANLSQNAMAMFPWYLMSSYPQLFQQQQQQQPQLPNGFGMPMFNTNNNTLMFNNNVLLNAPGFENQNIRNADLGGNGRVIFGYRIMDDQSQVNYIQQNGGYEFVIAPLWKRAVAEFIDMILLLILKIILTVAIINKLNLDLGLALDPDALHKVLEEDAKTIFTASFDFFVFSTDFLLIELITKLLVCFYEAILTAWYDGATIGKRIMGLRIKQIEAMLPLPRVPVNVIIPPLVGMRWQPQRTELRALLFPAETPSFKRAAFRALGKNLIISLLFPMCPILMFFKHNRTVYDVCTKTVVVEHNPQPIHRRP